MKKLLGVLALFLMLSLPGCAYPSTMDAQRRAVVTITDAQAPPGLPVCTGYAVAKHEVLTASHCLTPTTLVGGLPVEEKARDGHDHSLLCVKADLHPQGPKVIPTHPKVGELIHYWGHAGGNPLLYRQGAYAGPAAFNGNPIELYDMNGWHGDSGAPLFNSRGQLVGVVTGSYSIETWIMQLTYPLAFTPEKWNQPCP